MPMARTPSVHTVMFSEAELFGAFRLVMSERDARRMARACGESPGEGGEDYTLDTLLLLSLHSPALDARVQAHHGALWVGLAGEARRREWDIRRASLKAILESGASWSSDQYPTTPPQER